MANQSESDYYDEELDQESTVRDGADKADKDSGYESFLAPKSAFAGKSLEVGDVHRVRVERLLDSEVQLVCLKSGGKDEPESEDNATEESDEMYQ